MLSTKGTGTGTEHRRLVEDRMMKVLAGESPGPPGTLQTSLGTSGADNSRLTRGE